MGWYKPKITRVTLEELGYKEFWADVLAFESLPYGEAKEWMNKYAGKSPDQLNTSEDEDILADTVSKFVIGWNLTDPDTDKELPLPGEEIAVLDKLPLEILNYIIEKGLKTGTTESPPN